MRRIRNYSKIPALKKAKKGLDKCNFLGYKTASLYKYLEENSVIYEVEEQKKVSSKVKNT